MRARAKRVKVFKRYLYAYSILTQGVIHTDNKGIIREIAPSFIVDGIDGAIGMIGKHVSKLPLKRKGAELRFICDERRPY